MYVTTSKLKDWLLPESLRADYKWDDVVNAIGAGVTTAFDTYTNRTLAYTAGKQDTFRASLDAYVVSTYPIVTITSLDYEADLSTGWESQTVNDSIYTYDAGSGLVQFTSALGTSQELVRITYTGGYWYATTTYATLPAGATALPDDLLFAFKIQCEKVWNLKDKLGRNVLEQPQPVRPLYTAELDEEVVQILKFYRRHLIL